MSENISLTSASQSRPAQRRQHGVSVIAPEDERVQSTDLTHWARTVLTIESKKQRVGMTSLRALAAARILKHQTKKGLQ